MSTAAHLREAANSGNADALLAALDAGAEVNGRGEYGDTALNIACEKGHEGIVAILLAAGADIENLGGADKTPIMNAAFAGHIPIVRTLIEHGARISDDLLNSLDMKVGILEENAEAGMVLPQAVDAWRGFLAWMVGQRRKQDEGSH